jgi:c-di-GMP-binding flagellar brake protein YcgR
MTNSKSFVERRHPRLVEAITAHYRTCGGRQVRPVTIQNLSAGGAAVLAPARIPLHSTLEELRFALPPLRQQPGAFIAVSAFVRWVEKQTWPQGGTHFLHGLQFLDLEGKALTRVRNYVYYRLCEAPVELAQSRLSVADQPRLDRTLIAPSPA